MYVSAPLRIFFAAGVWALVFAYAPPANASDPIGYLDVLAVGVAHGWAYDADQPGTALNVDFYADGPAGEGVYVDTAVADQPRPDLVGTPYEDHAFDHPLPAWIIDGESHAIYAHARNVGLGQDSILINSPKLMLGESVEIWMCKGNPWLLGTSPDWEFVKHNVDVIKLYVDQVNSASVEDLRNLVDVCKEHSIKIAIELGGLVDWRADDVDSRTGESLTAENSFSDEYAKVKRLTDPLSEGGAGGVITYLDIDGPIRRSLYPFGGEQFYHTLDSATDELVEVLQLWRQQYPELKFLLLTNFPNWGWRGEPAYFNFGYAAGPLGYGDYFDALEMAIQKTNAAAVPLTGLTVDNPYDYAIGAHASNQQSLISSIDFMSRLRDLENYVEGQGLQFDMIYNSARAGNQSTGSNQLYYDETLEFIDAHLAYGATPLRYIIQSWYFHPTGWVPETSGYTMTHLAADVIRKLRESLNVPPRFRVTNRQGWTVAEVYASGNLVLAGSVAELAVPALTSGDEFVVKGPGGTPVALIDSGGNLVLAGTLYRNQSSLDPPPGSFVIRSSAGRAEAYIDSAGNMYLRGTVSRGD
jgi:hypothetical protein